MHLLRCCGDRCSSWVQVPSLRCCFLPFSFSMVVEFFVPRTHKIARTNKKGNPKRGGKAAPHKRRRKKAAPPKGEADLEAPPKRRRRKQRELSNGKTRKTRKRKSKQHEAAPLKRREEKTQPHQRRCVWSRIGQMARRSTPERSRARF